MNKLSAIAIAAVVDINALKIEEGQLALTQVDAEAGVSFAYTIQHADTSSADISDGPGYFGPNHHLPSQMSYLGGSETWDWARSAASVWWTDYFGVFHQVKFAPGEHRTTKVHFPVVGRDWYWYNDGATYGFKNSDRERTGFGSDC